MNTTHINDSRNLSNNHLDGSIPSSIGNLSKLTGLYLDCSLIKSLIDSLFILNCWFTIIGDIFPTINWKVKSLHQLKIWKTWNTCMSLSLWIYVYTWIRWFTHVLKKSLLQSIRCWYSYIHWKLARLDWIVLLLISVTHKVFKY